MSPGGYIPRKKKKQVELAKPYVDAFIRHSSWGYHIRLRVDGYRMRHYWFAWTFRGAERKAIRKIKERIKTMEKYGKEWRVTL